MNDNHPTPTPEEIVDTNAGANTFADIIDQVRVQTEFRPAQASLGSLIYAAYTSKHSGYLTRESFLEVAGELWDAVIVKRH